MGINAGRIAATLASGYIGDSKMRNDGASAIAAAINEAYAKGRSDGEAGNKLQLAAELIESATLKGALGAIVSYPPVRALLDPSPRAPAGMLNRADRLAAGAEPGQVAVIREVIGERVRQIAKHGSHNDDLTNPHEWVSILAEEFGEWAKGLLEGSNAREEAVHVAAVAVAFCEWWDKRPKSEDGEPVVFDGEIGREVNYRWCTEMLGTAQCKRMAGHSGGHTAHHGNAAELDLKDYRQLTLRQQATDRANG